MRRNTRRSRYCALRMRLTAVAHKRCRRDYKSRRASFNHKCNIIGGITVKSTPPIVLIPPCGAIRGGAAIAPYECALPRYIAGLD